MPHIIVKMYPGRTEAQKVALTRKIVENVVTTLECSESVVSVAFEEIEKEKWAENVYQPDIIDTTARIYKEPGYNPFADEAQKQSASTQSLQDFVRSSAAAAEQNESQGNFNAMSWLDLMLEDHPHMFDEFFDKNWHVLTDKEKQQRTAEIRKAL